MEDIRLPRHVIDRLEHRWASRLQQDVKAWSSERSKPSHCASGANGRREGHPGHRQTRSRSERQGCPRKNEKAKDQLDREAGGLPHPTNG